MSDRLRLRTVGAAALALAAVLGTIVTIPASGTARADVCVSAGRRVSVSGCGNLADAVAPYVPPPAYYAPLPDDPRRRTSRLCQLQRPMGQRRWVQLI